MSQPTEPQIEQTLGGWLEQVNTAFGLELTADRPNFQVVTQGAVKISIFPVILTGELFFSAELKNLHDPSVAFLKRILSRNAFQHSSNDGWFAFDDVDDVLLWQYKWIGFGQASFEEFCECLGVIMARSDQIAREVDVDADLADAREIVDDVSADQMIRV